MIGNALFFCVNETKGSKLKLVWVPSTGREKGVNKTLQREMRVAIPVWICCLRMLQTIGNTSNQSFVEWIMSISRLMVDFWNCYHSR